MSRDWEAQFREWAKPPGATEQGRCNNAGFAIRNAIKASDKLHNRGVSVFAQGSYRNNTNVRKDSDVDIGILFSGAFFHDPLPEGLTKERLGFSDATYHYVQYKNEVEEAIVNYFGRSAVKRGNKAFDVHETSYHVEADVAAFFEHRRYKANGTYIKGMELRTDKENNRIINFPEQHYENGVSKNMTTGKRFKSIVRVLKALSNEMIGQGVQAAAVPGFFLECLTFNIPNDRFGNYTYTADVKAALVFIYENTNTDACMKWVEVSELKRLFHETQKWTRQQANAFAYAAWNYDGLGGES